MSVDMDALVAVEEMGGHFRGRCVKCGRLSWRWWKWEHVELWFVRHLCEPRKMTSTGLK